LLLGPIFARELVTLPRRGRFYFARAAFVGTLLVLSITAWLVLSEQRPVRGVGELARFGVLAFRFLAPLQLLATVFFGALAAASAVAVEKDRRTLDLLLLTKLNNAELVLGKLAASLAFVMAMLLGALPLFMLGMLWGGISPTQVAHAFAVCLVATLAAGSVGSTVALWREKTFQTLAITALLLVFWWAAGELVAAGVLGRSWAGTDCQTWAVAISPVRAVLEATHPWSPAPLVQGVRLSPVLLFLLVGGLMTLGINLLAVARVRAWNPSHEARTVGETEASGVWSQAVPHLQAWRLGSRSQGEENSRAGFDRTYEVGQQRAEDSSASPHAGLGDPATAAAGASAAAATAPAVARTGVAVGSGQAAAGAAGVSTAPMSIALANRGAARMGAEGAAAATGVAARGAAATGGAASAVGSRPRRRAREVWDNPILWREIRTWAYGRKVLLVKLAYVALFGLAAAAVTAAVAAGPHEFRAAAVLPMASLAVLSLVLINAQAVTALTSERDARALDLLLVTDLSPKEFIYGKLGGIFYNTKEMLLLPAGLCVYLWLAGMISLQNTLYLLGGGLVIAVFVAVLGLHVGMAYASSRAAIAVSLGTVFFLSVGVYVCMQIMEAFAGAFQVQIFPFTFMAVGGAIGLWLALGIRNPSSAISYAAVLCPLATFWSIVSFELQGTLGVFLVLSATYGFTTAAMLVPAVSEFDVATGRTTAGEA
jgi:ABC-type transport system involved in multi-copper enzyme maturation permease subunit